VEDTHLALIREMWMRVDDRSSDSILEFVQHILAKQVEWGREAIDTRAIAPEVALLLMQIREQGLRATIESYV
jgi:hypothetical protein